MHDPKTTLPLDWQPPTATYTEAQLSLLRLPPVPLKTRPQYGVFLWWPADPNLWAHPNDFETIERFVPGSRVFRRDTPDDYSDRELGFVVYEYGEVRFRAKPMLWREVKPEGYQPGDRVEIKAQSGKTRPLIATISDVLWNRHNRSIEYRVIARGMPLRRLLTGRDLRPAIPIGGHLPTRHLDLSRRENAF